MVKAGGGNIVTLQPGVPVIEFDGEGNMKLGGKLIMSNGVPTGAGWHGGTNWGTNRWQAPAELDLRDRIYIGKEL
jgi:hypothetical protein